MFKEKHSYLLASLRFSICSLVSVANAQKVAQFFSLNQKTTRFTHLFFSQFKTTKIDVQGSQKKISAALRMFIGHSTIIFVNMPRKGTYSINTLLKVIAKKTNGTGTKSVTTAPAQTFDLCKDDQEPAQLHLQISSALKHWQINYPILYYFATIQLQTGARVSEILRLHSKEITPDGRILIRSLKGGNDRVVQISDLAPWLNLERSKSRYLFRDLTRFVIHHNYVKQGISAYFGNNQKRSTTHLFRHLVGIDLTHLEDHTHGIKTALGQKTDSAADHYKTKVRRQNDQ